MFVLICRNGIRKWFLCFITEKKEDRTKAPRPQRVGVRVKALGPALKLLGNCSVILIMREREDGTGPDSPMPFSLLS